MMDEKLRNNESKLTYLKHIKSQIEYAQKNITEEIQPLLRKFIPYIGENLHPLKEIPEVEIKIHEEYKLVRKCVEDICLSLYSEKNQYFESYSGMEKEFIKQIHGYMEYMIDSVKCGLMELDLHMASRAPHGYTIRREAVKINKMIHKIFKKHQKAYYLLTVMINELEEKCLA